MEGVDTGNVAGTLKGATCSASSSRTEGKNRRRRVLNRAEALLMLMMLTPR